MERIIFDNAKISDLPWIASCMEANLFDNLTEHTQWRLYYEISEDELRTCVSNQNNIFICARAWEKVLGYTLWYDVKEWMKKKETRLDDLQISEDYKEKIQHASVLYARHIAIDPAHHHKGIGKLLAKKAFDEAQQRWYTDIVWEIMLSPMKNTRSIYVHQKAWFETIGEISYPDGTIWQVIWKNLK